MSSIRPAYSSWPALNRAFRDVVATLTEEQLALQPSPERWPLWATIGHAACQRVFWLCVFAGEPGAETTPFTNSGYSCPGDEDLEHVLNAEQLVEALDSSFRIIEGCLDRWTIEHARRGDPSFRRGWESGAQPRVGDPAGLHPRRLSRGRAERGARESPGCPRSTSGTDGRPSAVARRGAAHRDSRSDARRSATDRPAGSRAPADAVADRPDRGHRAERGPGGVEPPRVVIPAGSPDACAGAGPHPVRARRDGAADERPAPLPRRDEDLSALRQAAGLDAGQRPVSAGHHQGVAQLGAAALPRRPGHEPGVVAVNGLDERPQRDADAPVHGRARGGRDRGARRPPAPLGRSGAGVPSRHARASPSPRRAGSGTVAGCRRWASPAPGGPPSPWMRWSSATRASPRSSRGSPGHGAWIPRRSASPSRVAPRCCHRSTA